MTDNEIIKALNYCCGNIKNNDEGCNKDMCYQVTLPESRDEGIRFCRQWLIKDALDLINRQKAEIERLQDKLIISDGEEIKLCDDMYVLKDELQRAKVEISKHFDYMDEAANEAIEDFAERLKHFIIPQKADGYTREIVLKRDIDNLVKEMTEVEE